ncbi:TorD/DmsD family molecular chaperone [Roseibium sp.]|uniref:TorD/DmsD family molecular chaperone n=1 Tax=Roseibium sp. TaxID=1936156 RepID=UPI003A969EA2
MSQMTSQTHAIAPEDADRAVIYGFVGRLLQAPPSAGDMDVLRALTADETEMGLALKSLSEAAQSANVNSLKDEYNALFIGLGRGELVPYGSFYLTGFLNEKPLAELRADMGVLGIARADTVKEPEDHIAALLQCMEGLITGAFGEPATLPIQEKFFTCHIASWAPHFFRDLTAQNTSAFYAAVGALGGVLVALETEAFGMAG